MALSGDDLSSAGLAVDLLRMAVCSGPKPARP